MQSSVLGFLTFTEAACADSVGTGAGAIDLLLHAVEDRIALPTVRNLPNWCGGDEVLELPVKDRFHRAHDGRKERPVNDGHRQQGMGRLGDHRLHTPDRGISVYTTLGIQVYRLGVQYGTYFGLQERHFRLKQRHPLGEICHITKGWP
jgi:hypothetical protein